MTNPICFTCYRIDGRALRRHNGLCPLADLEERRIASLQFQAVDAIARRLRKLRPT